MKRRVNVEWEPGGPKPPLCVAGKLTTLSLYWCEVASGGIAKLLAGQQNEVVPANRCRSAHLMLIVS